MHAKRDQIGNVPATRSRLSTERATGATVYKVERLILHHYMRHGNSNVEQQSF